MPPASNHTPGPASAPGRPSPLRRVAVLAGSSLTWREQVMRGIAGYSNEHGRWHVYTAPEGAEDSVFFSNRYQWDGLIVRPTSARFVSRVAALGVPAVAIGSVRPPSLRLPRVKVDDDELTRTALRHLISGGLRRFAYCGFFPSKASEDRGPAFARAAAAAGLPCDFFVDFARPAPSDTWQKRQRDLARWARRLDKPVGVLAWNPDVACQLVEACNVAGVAVPGEVAVVAADDDRMKCELTSPTISAVPVPAAGIGYEAAALLDALMRGDVRTTGEESAAGEASPPADGGVVLFRGTGAPPVQGNADLHGRGARATKGVVSVTKGVARGTVGTARSGLRSDTLRPGTPAAVTLVKPSGVVTVRESSDTAGLADRDVHTAVQFIRDHAHAPLSVTDVAAAVRVSRRWLERHFRRVLGCSPHDQIARHRLEAAKRLLLDTDWPVAKVAKASGFTSAPYLNHAFKKDAGLTPAGFRRRYRLD